MDTVALPDDAMVERRIVVRGRVQGVGYRWFAREQARELGVRGWARNLPDGSVVVEAAASAPAMERFIETLKIGPAGATVSEVSVGARTDTSPLLDSFMIVR